MVTTRSSGSRPNGSSHGSTVAPDANRIIAVVTGANSGFGLAICHRLLADLSLPPNTPIPDAQPQLATLAPSLRHLVEESSDTSTSDSASSSSRAEGQAIPSDPPAVTLVLACRTRDNAETARETILQAHDQLLRKRNAQGLVRRGWREGLRVEYELVDLDAVEGDKGTLRFAERLKARYPHITTLFLNAGMTMVDGVNVWGFLMQTLREGFVNCLTDPKFYNELTGVMSADGQRGKVWGINVLAGYLLARELEPLLRQSPASLPIEPRIVYTSSNTAQFRRLKPHALDDPQLLKYDHSQGWPTYPASKYMGDLVMVQLDKDFNADEDARPLRCVVADPGYAQTSFVGFGSFAPIVLLFQWGWVISFWLARMLGSTVHGQGTIDGAVCMIYSALVADRFLIPASKVPAPRFRAYAHRFSPATVLLNEVNEWEKSEPIGQQIAKICEDIRLEGRRREKLE